MKSIVVESVSKSFKDRCLFKDVSIQFSSNHIYGIVGPNGCGKTVFMKLLCGLSKPSSGQIIIDDKVLNKDIDFPQSVGVIIDKPEFFEEFNGLENLMLLRNIKKSISKDTVKGYFEKFGLIIDKKPVAKYSLGMRQRLGLAQAFMETPELVILDEYTNGLDKSGAQMVKSFLMNYKSDERIIILSSHYEQDLNDVVDVCYEIDQERIKRL